MWALMSRVLLTLRAVLTPLKVSDQVYDVDLSRLYRPVLHCGLPIKA